MDRSPTPKNSDSMRLFIFNYKLPVFLIPLCIRTLDTLIYLKISESI